MQNYLLMLGKNISWKGKILELEEYVHIKLCIHDANEMDNGTRFNVISAIGPHLARITCNQKRYSPSIKVPETGDLVG